MQSNDAAAEGRAATRPSQFAWKDWKEILSATKDEMANDNVSLIAAGVAFYAMLAFFPGLAALISIYGVFASASDVADHLGTLRAVLPADAFALIEEQVNSLTATSGQSLGLASIVGTLLALWSAKAGVSATVQGLNIVYGETDQRPMLTSIAVTFILTFLLLVVVLVALAIIVGAPAAFAVLNLGAMGEWIAAILRWPIGAAVVVLGIGVLYRYGPNRVNARLPWISWGAAIAALIWLVGSMLFSLYVANFANYNETYGSLGAVIVLLMWFYLSAFIVLMGAELNAEMEHHTRADTTTGPRAPRGERGPYVADDVA